MTIKKCRVCGDVLVVGENTTENKLKNYQYDCMECQKEYNQEQRHKSGRYQPMNENKNCSSYLGVFISEQVLSKVFKNVEKAPYGNPGYDFTCGKGFLIDVKSGCRHVREGWSDSWLFVIKKNKIADYFLCLAFNNRNDLTPEHIWLIPGENVNDRSGIGISESTLDRWQEYVLPIDKVIKCCDTMK